MKRLISSSSVAVSLAVVGILGCNSSTAISPKVDATTGHTHEHGEVLTFPSKGMVDESDFKAWFGYHGSEVHAGETVEPAAAISLKGIPVTDAKVFVSLVKPDGSGEVVAAEVPTIHEAATDHEIAHYAQGNLKVPADAKKIVIRFRVKGLPGIPEVIKDVVVELH